MCADDPVVIAHASRVLLKNVRSMTRQRWRQSGFRNAHGSNQAGGSMRNLMGQVDGTVNIHDEVGFDRHVWDDGSEQPWFSGGTVLVLRRIRADMDGWDELDRDSKELVVGRRLSDGAPLTGSAETDEPDFEATIGESPSSLPIHTSPWLATVPTTNSFCAGPTTTTTLPNPATPLTAA